MVSKEKMSDFTLKKICTSLISDFQSLNPWLHLQKKNEKNPHQSDFQTFKVWKSEAPKVWKSEAPIFNSFQYISRVQT